MSHPSSPDVPACCVRASVSVGANDTPYFRSGRGAPVVLLCDAPGEGEPPLVLALAARFRVVAPKIAARGDAFADWLRDFLDGLGLESACLVAVPSLSGETLRFAAEEPARVRAVVLLGGAAPEGAPAHPLLVHPLDEPAPTSAAIAPFIAAHA
jgi:pimeloyl-ACP methyl ester carboxylesterase